MLKSQRIAVFCKLPKKIQINSTPSLRDSSALIFIFIIYTIFTEPLQYFGGRNKDFVKKRLRHMMSDMHDRFILIAPLPALTLPSQKNS